MRVINLLSIIFLVGTISFSSSAQDIINAYGEVTNVAGTTLSMGAILEDYHTFEVGEEVIIMQMQDDVIGTTTNDQNFGNLQGIDNAGLFEFATVQSITESSGPVENIWVEDFEDSNPGDTFDNDPTVWGTGCYQGATCGTFQVYDGSPAGFTNVAAVENTGGASVSYWASEVIDIAKYSRVDVQMTLFELGHNQNADLVYGVYSIDGGALQFLTNGQQQNTFGTATASLTNITGQTLQVAVLVRNNAGGEYGGLDDVQITGTVGTPTSIELTSALTNSYTTGANSSVQLISYRQYQNFATNNDLSAAAWDGQVGGVLAMKVTDTLTLQNNITVDNLGFRGGAPNTTSDGSACDGTIYRSNVTTVGQKGEGIYKSSNANYATGRARILTGGGGGSFHNAGGGGGGNFTAGGEGGQGWSGGAAQGCDPSAGGFGGIDLSAHISASRLFLGGGGGGGQQNNNVSTNGGNGGGLILIKANTVITTGGCGTINVSANGEDVALSGNDGGGGGGAGGSILFEVDNWSLACQVDFSATGGDGSSVNTGNTHGGGGGGGRGVIVFSSSSPSANFSTDNGEGTGGANSNSGNGGDAETGESTPSDPDADPDGVMDVGYSPLPVELLYWRGEAQDNTNRLYWATASEQENDYFTIERSTNGAEWTIVDRVSGAGNSNTINKYEYDDRQYSSAITYYRLSQTDYDGTTEVFKMIALESKELPEQLLIYPNPNDGYFVMQLSGEWIGADLSVQIYNMNGKAVETYIETDYDKLKFDLSGKKAGHYLIRISNGISLRNMLVQVR